MKKQRKIAAALGALTVSSAFLSGCGPAQEVYGPPPATPPATQYQASQNLPTTVYGPPPTTPGFSPDEVIPEDVSGHPIPYAEEDFQQASEGDARTEDETEPGK